MITLNGSSGVTTPGISNSEGYTGDGLTIAAGAPSGAVTVDSSGNIGIGTSSPAAFGSDTVLVVYNASTPRIKLQNSTTGAANTDGAEFNMSGSDLIVENREAGNTRFFVNAAERARIDSSGNLLVGTTSVLGKQTNAYDGNTAFGLALANTAGGTAGQIAIRFMRNGSDVGSVTTTNTATAYNTSSDYRLKENIQPMTGALSKVAALKPCTYKWKADGSDGEGFIAHELAEVVPQCVTGEKDAVDAEGKPVYQGIDTSFLAGLYAAAIQELHQIVKDQAAEIAALKGQA